MIANTGALSACVSGLPGKQPQTTVHVWWGQQFTGVTGKEDPTWRFPHSGSWRWPAARAPE
ncbi:MAG TPA: hypothetical protein VGP33_05035 [Chloroflexota bacterium]|jgi:hypothetical protein|nr:hypothetical protein [Chloroflexota bacterium]